MRGKLGRAATLAMALLALGGLLAGAPATVAAQDAPAELAKITDYQAARWHRLHFKPAIETATNEQCLACHQEILTGKVREASPAGLKSANAEAWYQTLDTYTGPQETFHARHMTTPFAKQVMNLNCTFCHLGADPREKAPGSHADGQEPAASTQAPAAFTLRKTVNPSETCVRCHGRFPNQNMGIEPWTTVREGMETPEAPNGCMTCHAELFRTVRHQVSYSEAGSHRGPGKDQRRRLLWLPWRPGVVSHQLSLSAPPMAQHGRQPGAGLGEGPAHRVGRQIPPPSEVSSPMRRNVQKLRTERATAFPLPSASACGCGHSSGKFAKASLLGEGQDEGRFPQFDTPSGLKLARMHLRLDGAAASCSAHSLTGAPCNRRMVELAVSQAARKAKLRKRV